MKKLLVIAVLVLALLGLFVVPAVAQQCTSGLSCTTVVGPGPSEDANCSGFASCTTVVDTDACDDADDSCLFVQVD